MDMLRAMQVFSRVVDEGGFASASRALDSSPAVVTRLIAELEAHLGARLLHRTTRRLALTDVGAAYLERTRHILAAVKDAESLAGSAVSDVRGNVRVLAPPAVAVHQLAKHLPEFRRRYPLVTVEVSAPGAVPAVDENFDITLIARRTAPDGDYVARLLALTEVIPCAAPAYLERRSRPNHPSELQLHDLLVPPVSDVQRGVRFVHCLSGENHDLVPEQPSVLMSTLIDMNFAAALAGLGIAALPSFVIDDALRHGALERVIPEWRMYSSQLWIGMPSRRYVPARTRVLWEYLLSVFGGEERDPWLAAAGCETRKQSIAPA
jgi:DNA-binding transcriptional LysR family regulator